MTDPDEVLIRPYEAGDEAAIVACWNRIMPAQDGRPARNLAFWRWQFDANPHGEKRLMLAVLGDGAVVGQYGGIPFRARAEAGTGTIVSAIDLMVLPEYRRRMARPGLFVEIGRRYYERYCGAGGDLMSYGHTLRAWRIGARYLGYENVRDTDVLFRECAAPGFAPRPSASDELEVVEVERPGAAGDALWPQVAAEAQLAVIRDGAFLQWRYADHPDRCYTLLLCRERRTGKPRGLAVFRVADFVVAGNGLCMDWLCPRADLEAESVLLGALEALAVRRGAAVLSVLFPKFDTRFMRWQRHGFMVSPTGYFMGMVTFKYDVVWMRENWHYNFGDTDLV
jgi:hypothetical protein